MFYDAYSVAQLCLTPCMTCSLPGSSSVHRIFQARILQCVSSSREYFQPGIEPESPALAGGFFTGEAFLPLYLTQIFYRMNSIL